MCVREGCIQRLCRSNGSIFHQSSIVPGMAFIHYSFNFKWSFVDTFLGSRPDPCLWTRDIYHSPLSSNTATWLSSSHIGNLAALKRCSVFRSLANEVTLFMLCHLSRQPIISVHLSSSLPAWTVHWLLVISWLAIECLMSDLDGVGWCRAVSRLALDTAISHQSQASGHWGQCQLCQLHTLHQVTIRQGANTL